MDEVQTLNPNISKTDDLLNKLPKSKVMTPKRKTVSRNVDKSNLDLHVCSFSQQNVLFISKVVHFCFIIYQVMVDICCISA